MGHAEDLQHRQRYFFLKGFDSNRLLAGGERPVRVGPLRNE